MRKINQTVLAEKAFHMSLVLLLPREEIVDSEH